MSEQMITHEPAFLGFQGLKVWQLAMELVVLVRDFTEQLPNGEQHQITSQLRRASVSIPINIAEGKGRNTSKDYAHFVAMARGSACEVWTLLEICNRIKLGPDPSPCKAMAERVMQMLWKLGGALTRDRPRRSATAIEQDRV